MSTIVTEFVKFKYNRIPVVRCTSGVIFQLKVDDIISDNYGRNLYQLCIGYSIMAHYIPCTTAKSYQGIIIPSIGPVPMTNGEIFHYREYPHETLVSVGLKITCFVKNND